VRGLQEGLQNQVAGRLNLNQNKLDSHKTGKTFYAHEFWGKVHFFVV
jgi:hypothetical protein